MSDHDTWAWVPLSAPLYVANTTITARTSETVCHPAKATTEQLADADDFVQYALEGGGPEAERVYAIGVDGDELAYLTATTWYRDALRNRNDVLVFVDEDPQKAVALAVDHLKRLRRFLDVERERRTAVPAQGAATVEAVAS
jgi:hypothetical protein